MHTSPAEITAEGDEYFVGTFNDAGVGETVGYNVGRKDVCQPTFDESNPAASWCTGKTLADEVYDAAKIKEAATRMAAIPVEGKSQLLKPEFPADVKCP
jgi:hypothetical protein